MLSEYVFLFIIIFVLDTIINAFNKKTNILNYFLLFCFLLNTYTISSGKESSYDLETLNCILIGAIPLILSIVNMDNIIDIITSICNFFLVLIIKPNTLYYLHYSTNDGSIGEIIIMFVLSLNFSNATNSILPLILWYSSCIKNISHILEILLIICFSNLTYDIKKIIL